MIYPFYEDRGTEVHCRRRKRLRCNKHIHDHVELVVMIKGKATAYIENKPITLDEGNAFIAFPNQIHYFSDDYGEFDSLLFIFPSNLFSEFSKTFKTKQPISPIIPIDAEELSPVLQLTLKEKYTPSKFSDTIVKNCLCILLSNILRTTELVTIEKRNINALQSVLIYCGEHYTEDITLEKIAENTHMSKYYISHLFSKEIGMSFTEYISTLRIRDAESMLKKGDLSITEVAFSVGFNSLRSFNRHFFAQTGKTPRQVKRQDIQAEK